MALLAWSGSFFARARLYDSFFVKLCFGEGLFVSAILSREMMMVMKSFLVLLAESHVLSSFLKVRASFNESSELTCYSGSGLSSKADSWSRWSMVFKYLTNLSLVVNFLCSRRAGRFSYGEIRIDFSGIFGLLPPKCEAWCNRLVNLVNCRLSLLSKFSETPKICQYCSLRGALTFWGCRRGLLRRLHLLWCLVNFIGLNWSSFCCL